MVNERIQFLPCNCEGTGHGLLLTYDEEDDQVYISILDHMFNRRNAFVGRVVLAWKTLRGTLYDDLVIVDYKDLKDVVEKIKVE